jgi:hypothetical protein
MPSELPGVWRSFLQEVDDGLDVPVDLLREFDQQARRLGVTRQAFLKVRLADSLVKHQ